MRIDLGSNSLPTFEPKSPLRGCAYPEDLNDLAAGLTDDQALKKIGQRTSTSGKIITLLMVVGAVGLAWFYVQRSEKYESRMDPIVQAGKLEGDAMLASLRNTLEQTEYDDVKERALRNLGHFKDASAVPLITKQLDNGGIVRRAAALALASIGSPAADSAKPKLLEVLPKTDAKDKPQVVWALAVLKERAASDAIIAEFTTGLLQSQPGFDPKVITEALGIPKLSEPANTGHKEKSVRALVAMALSEAPSPEVVEPLVRMVEKSDEDPEVVRAAVMGLGRTGDQRAAAPLFGVMQSRPELRQSVLDALAKSTAAPQLALLLKEAKDVNAKRDLIRLLRKTFDPRAADAFAASIGDQDADIREEATQGLADLGDARAVPSLVELAKSEEDDVANDAVDALTRLANPEAAPALLPMLSDEKYVHRKASIMRALGATGAKDAGPQLLKELTGDDVGAAAKALGHLKYDAAYATFVKMLPRSAYKGVDFQKPGVPSEMAYRNRYEALQGLQHFGKIDAKLVKELITIIEDPLDDFRLSAEAGATLGQLADAETYALMVQKVLDAKLQENIRVFYAQGLWRKPSPEVAVQLVPLLSGQTPGAIKTAAALAIGYAGSPTTDADLLSLLDNADARRYAAMAIVLGGSEEAARKLIEVLPKDRDAEEILRMAVNSTEDDNFNLLTKAMFESGQIYRRLRVAEILKEGNGLEGSAQVSYSYVWVHLTTRLRAGWDGPGGMSERAIRNALDEQLKSQDPERRRLIATAMGSMNYRGLLLAARDAGVKEARDTLMELDRPKDVKL
jgi:HEAT repeat protein